MPGRHATFDRGGVGDRQQRLDRRRVGEQPGQQLGAVAVPAGARRIRAVGEHDRPAAGRGGVVERRRDRQLVDEQLVADGPRAPPELVGRRRAEGRIAVGHDLDRPADPGQVHPRLGLEDRHGEHARAGARARARRPSVRGSAAWSCPGARPRSASGACDGSSPAGARRASPRAGCPSPASRSRSGRRAAGS